SLRWPRQVTPDELIAVLRQLAAAAVSPVVVQAVGTDTGVEHTVAVPLTYANLITEQLRTAVPGIAVVELEHPFTDQAALTGALRLALTTRRRPLRTSDHEPVARALLTALADVHRGELLVLQWLLGPR